ncbi:MAG: CpsB/CapC family capsule biosynthesis tyrosine phosphatase, partial [Thermoleophilaceae bacterium]
MWLDGPATLAESIELIRAAQAEGTDAGGGHAPRALRLRHGRARTCTSGSASCARPWAPRVSGWRCAPAASWATTWSVAWASASSTRSPRVRPEVGGCCWRRRSKAWATTSDDAAAELRDRGFGVVVAHPERSADAQLDGSAGLRRQIAAGAGAQVNAQSITGAHGPAARTAALKLVGEGLVTIVGSDAHGPTRPPLLAQARRELAQAGLGAGCRALTMTGPLSLLARGLTPRPARQPARGLAAPPRARRNRPPQPTRPTCSG